MKAVGVLMCFSQLNVYELYGYKLKLPAQHLFLLQQERKGSEGLSLHSEHPLVDLIQHCTDSKPWNKNCIYLKQKTVTFVKNYMESHMIFFYFQETKKIS